MKRRDWLRGLAAIGFVSVFGDRVLARRSQDKPEFFGTPEPTPVEPKSLGKGIVTGYEDHGIRGESVEITYFDEETDQAPWESEELEDDAPLPRMVRPSVEVRQEFSVVPPPESSMRTYAQGLTAGQGRLELTKDGRRETILFTGLTLTFEHQSLVNMHFCGQEYQVYGPPVHGSMTLQGAVCSPGLAGRLMGMFADYLNLPNAVLRLGQLGDLELVKPIMTGYTSRISSPGEPEIFSEMSFVFVRALTSQ